MRPDIGAHRPQSFAINKVLGKPKIYSRERRTHTPLSYIPLIPHSLIGTSYKKTGQLSCENKKPHFASRQTLHAWRIFIANFSEAPRLLFCSFTNEALKSFCNNVVFLISLVKWSFQWWGTMCLSYVSIDCFHPLLWQGGGVQRLWIGTGVSLMHSPAGVSASQLLTESHQNKVEPRGKRNFLSVL